MREAGRLATAALAQRFSDALLANGIDNRVVEEQGGFVVWIVDDDHLLAAKNELLVFLSNPDDAKYAEKRDQAESIRKQAEAEARRAQKQYVNLRARWQRGSLQRGKVTVGVVIACVVVTLLTDFGDRWPAGLLYIDSHTRELFADVRAGQVWRLFTPVLMHAGALHLIFNMLMLWSLGGMVEGRVGSGRLTGLVLLFAIGSNLVQYVWQGPGFLGISGVNYGLLGYAYVKGRLDPASGLGISEGTWLFMIGWLVLGFAGFMGMANGSHFGGLVLGVLAGGGAALFKRRR